QIRESDDGVVTTTALGPHHTGQPSVGVSGLRSHAPLSRGPAGNAAGPVTGARGGRSGTAVRSPPECQHHLQPPLCPGQPFSPLALAAAAAGYARLFHLGSLLSGEQG